VAGERGRPLAIDPEALREVEHGLAPVCPLAGPRRARGALRRPGRERRGRGAGADARQHHDPRPPTRGRRQGGQSGQALGRSRGGFSTKLHLRCDARGLPLAFVLTPGEAHEARAFADLVEDLAPGTRCLIGDMGYDADWLRQELLLRGILPVIPPNPVRKEPAPLDRELYRLRNRVERLVSGLKQFRGVATRYDKTAESFLAFVHLAAARVWLRFVHTA
jgi:transposase